MFETTPIGDLLIFRPARHRDARGFFEANAEDFIKATQRIYRSRNAPSFITINQLK